MPHEVKGCVRALTLAFQGQLENYSDLRATLTKLMSRVVQGAKGSEGQDQSKAESGDDETASLVERQRAALIRIEELDQQIRLVREKAAKRLGVEELTLVTLRRAADDFEDRELSALIQTLETWSDLLLREAKAVADLAGQVEEGLLSELLSIKREIRQVDQGKRMIKAYRTQGSVRDTQPRFLDQER